MLQATIENLKNALAKVAPRIVDLSLNKGASDADILRLEECIGKKLPDDLKALYLSINGNNDEDNFGNFFHGLVFNSVDEAINDWKFRKKFSTETDTVIRLKHFDPQIDGSNFYNLNWLRIADDGSRNGLYIDLGPSASGTYGQVIFLEGTEDICVLVAGSTEKLLELFISDLDNGQYFLASDALEDGNHWLETNNNADLFSKAYALKKG